MPDHKHAPLFELFNEIGIIEQLSRASLEARLPRAIIGPHFTMLNHLVRLGDGRAPIDMARAFQVPKSTLTHTLKGLEGQGLTEMRPNPADGRSKLVYLTPSGRVLRHQTIAALGPDFDRWLIVEFFSNTFNRLLCFITNTRVIVHSLGNRGWRNI